MPADEEEPEKLLKDFLHGLLWKVDFAIAKRTFNHVFDVSVSVMENLQHERISFHPVLRKKFPMPFYEHTALDSVTEKVITLEFR